MTTRPAPEVEVDILADVSPKTHSARDTAHFRAIVAASSEVSQVEQRLRDVIVGARAAGESWTVIGAALGTSRQNAQQRFGRD